MSRDPGTKRKGFSWAGIAALPVGLFAGILAGIFIGTEPGHIAIGAAIGAGMGIGIGVAWIAASAVWSSPEAPPDQ